ncbi:hypothetical protein AVEN_268027-1 [Araneus ventricosus]|uniref:Uncharacterized protein n=1 Tax=Araneus ventricosus TaxID=182803 RepID=A0A4Y2KD48_ARAVE|nr:hypothetical protein AVEN_268027-1 [Araneus ventricosus]
MAKEFWKIYCYENCPVKTVKQAGNGDRRFIHEYSGKHETQETRKITFAQISSTNRSINKSLLTTTLSIQLGVYQLTSSYCGQNFKEKFQRRPKSFQRRSQSVSTSWYLYPLPVGCDTAGKSRRVSITSLPIKIAKNSSIFEDLHFVAKIVPKFVTNVGDSLTSIPHS